MAGTMSVDHSLFLDSSGAATFNNSSEISVSTSGNLEFNDIVISDSTSNWIPKAATEDNSWKSVTWSPELNLLVAVAWSGTNRVMASPDGITWTARTIAEANQWRSVNWSPELKLLVVVDGGGTKRVS